MWYYYDNEMGMCVSSTPWPSYKPTKDEAMVDWFKRVRSAIVKEVEDAKRTIEYFKNYSKDMEEKYGYLIDRYPEYFV